MEGVLEMHDHEVVHVVREIGTTKTTGLPVEGGLDRVLDRQ